MGKHLEGWDAPWPSTRWGGDHGGQVLLSFSVQAQDWGLCRVHSSFLRLLEGAEPMSLVFGRGLGGDGAGAETLPPLPLEPTDLRLPCNLSILEWNWRQTALGEEGSAGQMLPTQSSSAYLSR